MSALAHILIDCENVALHIESLKRLRDNVRLYVFTSEKKLALPVVQALQPLGTAVAYMRTTRSGKNALDFHIAYTLGKLAATLDGKSRVFVISNDTGYDSLIQQILLENSYQVKRMGNFSKLPGDILAPESPDDVKTPPTPPAPPQPGTLRYNVEKASAFLKSRGNARPRKRQSLKTVLSQKMPELDDQKLDGLVEALVRAKVLSISAEEKITYHFEPTA